MSRKLNRSLDWKRRIKESESYLTILNLPAGILHILFLGCLASSEKEAQVHRVRATVLKNNSICQGHW
jgi:hypothetical protein